MQTITIEVRCDFELSNRDESEKIMIEVAREKAQELVTTAALMAGRRQPSVVVQCGDFFSELHPVDVVKE